MNLDIEVSFNIKVKKETYKIRIRNPLLLIKISKTQTNLLTLMSISKKLYKKCNRSNNPKLYLFQNMIKLFLKQAG